MNTRLKIALSFIVLASILLATPAFGTLYRREYYNANAGIPDATFGFIRSSTPIHVRTSEFDLFSGGSDLSVDKAEITTFDVGPGFSIYTGKKLREIHTITIAAVANSFRISGSASFALNIWLDTSEDGDFFHWSDGKYLDLGGDKYCLGGSGASGTSPVLTVDDTTTFFVIPDGTSPTFAALKATFPDALVAIWVGFYITGPDTGRGFASVTPSMISIS